MTPAKANKKKMGQEFMLINGDLIYLKPEKPRVAIGNKVRISKCKRQVFDKGYTPKWAEEIFVVDEVLPTKPVTHKIVDLSGETVEGTFSQQELQKAKQETFRIENVMRRDNKKKLALVKWGGDPDKFNSWVTFRTLVNF